MCTHASAEEREWCVGVGRVGGGKERKVGWGGVFVARCKVCGGRRAVL